MTDVVQGASQSAWESAPDSAVGASSLIYVLCCGPKCASEVYRRIKKELVIEVPMLMQGRWKVLLFGIAMQYVHGIFTQLAHRMHHPGEQLLHDVGFELTPELGPEMFWVSELIFGTLFVMFMVWTFTPFLFYRKRFYTVVLWCRLLMVLVVCQVLRMLSFSFTHLPGPSYHCRAGEPTAVRDWPLHWSEHLIVDVKRATTKSCGDLIFSSHTIFMLTGILAYNEFGTNVVMKCIAWISGAIIGILIIASRKHYTVDIIIAWYTVPLVFYTLQRRWTTVRPDSTAADPLPMMLLPGSSSSSLSSCSSAPGGGGGTKGGCCRCCCSEMSCMGSSSSVAAKKKRMGSYPWGPSRMHVEEYVHTFRGKGHEEDGDNDDCNVRAASPPPPPPRLYAKAAAASAAAAAAVADEMSEAMERGLKLHLPDGRAGGSESGDGGSDGSCHGGRNGSGGRECGGEGRGGGTPHHHHILMITSSSSSRQQMADIGVGISIVTSSSSSSNGSGGSQRRSTNVADPPSGNTISSNTSSVTSSRRNGGGGGGGGVHGGGAHSNEPSQASRGMGGDGSGTAGGLGGWGQNHRSGAPTSTSSSWGLFPGDLGGKPPEALI